MSDHNTDIGPVLPGSAGQWERRRAAGWFVRAAIVAIPLLASLACAWVLTRMTPQPRALLPAGGRWLAIAVVSSLVLVGVERLARRLMPLAALLDLSLVFPDRAPSRFGVALRSGTTHQLERRIDEARRGAETDTPAEAARRVIELVTALRTHDHVTRGHSERVRAYTQMIADEMGLPADERDRLRWAGLLHDVGKLLVPTSILNRKGRLTAEEFEIVKAHPANGRQIIAGLIPWLGEPARAVWEHHEKWDGTGYPRGLKGEEISLAARIVAVADCYDVMTSARSYKDPISPREARKELARCAGSHFDPQVVRAFLSLSVGRVRRATGPAAWLAQLPLFPTAVFNSATAASTAVVMTGAIGASTASVGPTMMADAFHSVLPRSTSRWLETLDSGGGVAAAHFEYEIVESGAATGAGQGEATAGAPAGVDQQGDTDSAGDGDGDAASPVAVGGAVGPPEIPATPPDGAGPVSPPGGPVTTVVVVAPGTDGEPNVPVTTLATATTTLTVVTVPPGDPTPPADNASTTLAPPTIPATTLPATTLPATTTPPATTLPATTVPATTTPPATTIPNATPGKAPNNPAGAGQSAQHVPTTVGAPSPTTTPDNAGGPNGR